MSQIYWETQEDTDTVDTDTDKYNTIIEKVIPNIETILLQYPHCMHRIKIFHFLNLLIMFLNHERYLPKIYLLMKTINKLQIN